VIQTSIDTGIPVNFVDVDQNKELAQKFQVTSVPTLIVSDALGNVVKRSVGAMPKTALAQFLGSAK
jgi:thioredoxin-related protein